MNLILLNQRKNSVYKSNTPSRAATFRQKGFIMNNKNFEIGDRVKVVKSGLHFAHIGDEGTVVGKNCYFGHEYAVCFDNPISQGHDCEGRCKDGFGQYMQSSELELMASQSIVITSCGATITATIYHGMSRVKEASAKCAPDDKYDFLIGAKIAFDRLTGPAWNSKVVCINSQYDKLTVGKIYEIKDGVLTFDSGSKSEAFKDFDSFRRSFLSSFIEVVE